MITEQVHTRSLERVVAMRPRVVRWLSGLVGASDAEDVYQQAFIRAAEGVSALREPDALEGWFWSIARSQALTLLQRRGRELPTGELELPELSPEQAQQTCKCSLSALSKLKPEYHEIVRLVDVEGAAVMDVAKSLHISEGLASVRLHRARHALRARLEERCGTTSVQACLSCGCDEDALTPCG